MSKLYVGLVVKSYAELCRLVGEEAVTGNSRLAQEKRFKRHFDWEKLEGNSLIIVTIYEEQQPKPLRPDNKYGHDILTCLQWDCVEKDKTEGQWDNDAECMHMYTFASILTLCGFVDPQWQTKAEEVRAALSEFSEVGLPHKSKAQIARFFEDLDLHIRAYCGNEIDRNLGRLVKNGYLRRYEKIRWVEDGGGCRRATVEEEKICERIEESVKEELGVRFVTFRNSRAYYSKFNEKLRLETELRRTWKLREITVRKPFAPVSLEDYREARHRINQRSTEQFLSSAESDVRKGIERITHDLEESSDLPLLELIDLFEITSEDIYSSTYGDTERELQARESLASWFVELGVAEGFLAMAKRTWPKTDGAQNKRRS